MLIKSHAPQKDEKVSGEDRPRAPSRKGESDSARYLEKTPDDARNVGNVPKRKGRQPREPKDPSNRLFPFLPIASMSGHSEGSRAFARYRKIDGEMKRELVNLPDYKN